LKARRPVFKCPLVFSRTLEKIKKPYLELFLERNSGNFMFKNHFSTTEHAEISEEEETDKLTSIIIGTAIDVHRALGPGLLESTYEACMIYELQLRKLKVEHQKPLPIFYKDVMLA
jgi:hypothetical protein